MSNATAENKKLTDPITGSAQRDLLGGAIVVAAIVMFFGSAVDMLVGIVRRTIGHGSGDTVLATTVILNVALVLFSWRRYRDSQMATEERRRAEDRADVLQTRDMLTGLLNRNGLTGAGELMANSSARRSTGTAVLLVDLDCFKNVNDVYGMPTGDLMLKAVTDRITAIAPRGAQLGRIGGDEFVVAFTIDAADEQMPETVAEQLIQALGRPYELNGAVVAISASIGVAKSDLDGSTIETLLRRANIAMQASKNQGKNCYTWFDASMERELRARNDIEQGLRDGIPKGQFVPFFEKQIDLKTGKLRGFEVLARWIHPRNGIISPNVFIPVAEETGMIGDLSMSVMRQAFEQAKHWDPELTLSVNIAPTQLKDPWLSQKILKLLTETGFPSNRLEVEITETSLFDNLSIAQSIIGSLKNQGVRVALDDFGTGYSSLAHLRSLPFDRIKIDKSFVMSMNENRESAAIVNAITRLGDSLSLTITAEGIEDGETVDSLREIGCAKGQGWHYGKPLSGTQVERFLEQLDDKGVAASQSVVPAEGSIDDAGEAAGNGGPGGPIDMSGEGVRKAG